MENKSRRVLGAEARIQWWKNEWEVSTDTTFKGRRSEGEEGLEPGGTADSHFQIPAVLAIRGTGRWGKPRDISPQSCQSLLPPVVNSTSSATPPAICAPLLPAASFLIWHRPLLLAWPVQAQRRDGLNQVMNERGS